LAGRKVESHQGWALQASDRGLICHPLAMVDRPIFVDGRNLRLMPNLNLDIFLTLI